MSLLFVAGRRTSLCGAVSTNRLDPIRAERLAASVDAPLEALRRMVAIESDSPLKQPAQNLVLVAVQRYVVTLSRLFGQPERER